MNVKSEKRGEDRLHIPAPRQMRSASASMLMSPAMDGDEVLGNCPSESAIKKKKLMSEL